MAIRGRFGLVGMFPLPLTSSWCATWLALTKHGGVGESLEMLLIVFTLAGCYASEKVSSSILLCE